MRAAPLLLGGEATGDAAVRRALAYREEAALEIALERFDEDEAFEACIDESLTDADIVQAVQELGLTDRVEAHARSIVAERLRKGA